MSDHVTTTTKPYVTGLFRDRESAESAYQSLVARGYSQDDIDLVMSEDARKKHFTPTSETVVETDMGHKAMKGAGVGGAIGVTVGATLAAIAAVGTSLAIPGLGLVIAGPIVAALAGAGAGGAAGGLVGTLVGAGIPEERVKRYETGLKDGGIVLGVTPRTPEDEKFVQSEWGKYRGEDIVG